jgi:hypothetical protein
MLLTRTDDGPGQQLREMHSRRPGVDVLEAAAPHSSTGKVRAACLSFRNSGGWASGSSAAAAFRVGEQIKLDRALTR